MAERMSRAASDRHDNDQPQAGPSEKREKPYSSAVEPTLQAIQQGLSGITIAQLATRLVDLPAVWLLQLAPDACLPMFQTCRAMRDMVLSQRGRVRAQFQLPLTPPATAGAAQASLQRACQLAANVVLLCEGNTAARSTSDGSAKTLVINTMSLLGHPLSAITRVELRGLRLGNLVPVWLRRACPNMTSLTLDAWSSSLWPESTTNAPGCGQLQELCLIRPPEFSRSELTVAHWQHQFRSLTGLQRLSIHAAEWQHLELWLECSSAAGTHVTHLGLHLLAPGVNQDLPAKLPTSLPAWFPSLTELHVPTLIGEDHNMEVLLGMPGLKRLWFKQTELEHSYAHRPCGWTDLHFETLNMHQVARWPLEGNPSLHATSPGADEAFGVFLSQNGQVTQSAVAAIHDCGGIQWGAVERVKLCFYIGDGIVQWGVPGQMGIHVAYPDHKDDDCLAASLPILSGCRASCLILKYLEITAMFLATLQPHLASMPVTSVIFDSCSWQHPEVYALLLPSLPAHVHTVCLELNPGVMMDGEAQLAEMCIHAPRAVILQIVGMNLLSEYWQAGWQERVQEAMRAAGHEHVTLMHVRKA